jgi:hypothetical protein
MQFNIPKLLQFLDDPDTQAEDDLLFSRGNRSHATSIIGLIGEDLNAAVFKHYSNNSVEILPNNVTQGMRKGKWLDRWIADHEKKVLYQCEIKNWAGASLGGRTLSATASPELWQEVAQYNFGRLTNDLSKDKTHPTGLTKVLLPMKLPEGYSDYEVKPMLILWMLISDDFTELPPHFIINELPLTEHFSELHVFSVSLYLRKLLHTGTESNELSTPNIEQRMRSLNSFIK